MLRAGDLNRRVELQRAVTTPDEFNSPVTSWARIAEVAASKTDVSDGERLANAQVGAAVSARFRIRWSPEVAALSTQDRLRCEGRIYAISRVKEIGFHDTLEITAAAEG